MQSLTEQQARLLAFLKERIRETGIAPSFEEMKDHLGLKSKSGVHRIMIALQERRRIYRPFNRARNVEIIEDVDLSGVTADAMIAELKERGFRFGRIGYAK